MTKKQINDLLDKYWAAEATLEEESKLFAYFSSDEVLAEYQNLVPLFKTLDTKKNVRMNPSYNQSFWTQKAQLVAKPPKNSGRLLNLQKWAVAASFLLLVGFAAWFAKQNAYQAPRQTAEITDPQKALEESEMAIKYLISKLSKGQEATQSLEHLKSINIFQ